MTSQKNPKEQIFVLKWTFFVIHIELSIIILSFIIRNVGDYFIRRTKKTVTRLKNTDVFSNRLCSGFLLPCKTLFSRSVFHHFAKVEGLKLFQKKISYGHLHFYYNFWDFFFQQSNKMAIMCALKSHTGLAQCWWISHIRKGLRCKSFNFQSQSSYVICQPSPFNIQIFD